MIQATIAGKQFTFNNTDNNANIDVKVLDEQHLHIIYNYKSYNATLISFNKEEKKITVRINGNEYEVTLKNDTDLLLEKLGMNSGNQQKINNLKAPMPGLIINIPAKEGEHIKKGEPLIILEAMKMENVIKAPADVTVKKIRVNQKQAVEKGMILMEFGE